MEQLLSAILAELTELNSTMTDIKFDILSVKDSIEQIESAVTIDGVEVSEGVWTLKDVWEKLSDIDMSIQNIG